MRPAIVFHSSRNLPPARLPAVLTLWLLTFLACATPVVGDEEFPFTAWFTRDRTHLKSGPGDEHYVTDELPRGAAVEVYRRVEEGWLAVRPHASSFSWVAERDLRPTAMDDVFEIDGTDADSWND